jgi:hypothetical protein
MGSPYDLQLGTNARAANMLGDQYRLKLDPDIQAELDKLNYKLEFDRLQSLWYRPDWSVIDSLLSRPEFLLPRQLSSLPTSLGPAATGGTSPTPAAPTGSSMPPTLSSPENPTLRKGEASDVLRAVWQLPAVESTVNNMQKNLLSQWNRFGTGGKASLITASVIISAGAVAGIASSEPSRVWVLGKLSGVEIPVPKVDGLSFSLIAPRGIIGGAGLQYENNIFNAKAAFEQTKLPDNTRFNNVTLTVNLNVVEAISFLRNRSR